MSEFSTLLLLLLIPFLQLCLHMILLQRGNSYDKQDPTAWAATPCLSVMERIVSYFPANLLCIVAEFARMVARVKERSTGCKGRCSSAAGGLMSRGS